MNDFVELKPFFYVVYFVFGICIGSFLNVLIYRLPKGENIAYPASHCTKCNHKLKPYHNIPLFSWIFLGGRCAFCKDKISIIYPVVELLNGLLFVLALYLCNSHLESIFIALCFSMLLSLSFIDAKYKAVPESLLLLSLIFAVFSLSDELGLLLNGIKNALLFAGGISILKAFVSFFINFNRRGEVLEAMGDADTIIVALIGALLGVKLGLFAIFLSACFTLPFFMYVRIKGAEDFEMPFIPYLSMGFLCTYSFSEFFNEFLRSYIGF